MYDPITHEAIVIMYDLGKEKAVELFMDHGLSREEAEYKWNDIVKAYRIICSIVFTTDY